MAYRTKSNGVLYYEPEGQSIADRAASIAKSSTPMVAQARARSLAAANARGLANSTMALEAGESAALGYATPIASQESAQDAQAAGQEADRQSQERRLGDQLASQERIAVANVASADKQNQLGFANAVADNYQKMLSTAYNSPNMTAEQRGALQALALNRAQQMAAIGRSITGANIIW